MPSKNIKALSRPSPSVKLSLTFFFWVIFHELFEHFSQAFCSLVYLMNSSTLSSLWLWIDDLNHQAPNDFV
jgi:hypothetical protein